MKLIRILIEAKSVAMGTFRLQLYVKLKAILLNGFYKTKKVLIDHLQNLQLI